MTTNISNDEIRKELQARARAVAEQKREDGLRKQEAELEELRTTSKLYVKKNQTGFKFRGWLDALHRDGCQLVEIAGVVVVALPDTDVASEHGRRAYRERQARIGKLARPFLDAMLRAGDLDHVPPCDVCGDREATSPDASLQIVLCSDPKCRIGRRKAKGTRKPSSR